MRFSKLAAAVAVLLALPARPAQAWEVTWLGHAGFVLKDKAGTTVLVDPWLQNPKFPRGYKLPEHVDAILVSHGHFDHASNATELSKRYKAPVVGVFELAAMLAPKEGPQPIGGNVGGTFKVKDLKISLIPALHSSSTGGQNEPPQYAGCPVGFVLQAPGERTLVHAGDSGLTRDYETVRQLYHPQVAMLPIGGWFTMDPAQAAIAAGWLGVRDVVPMHYGTFPQLAGTPAELRAAGRGLKVHELTPGKTVRL